MNSSVKARAERLKAQGLCISCGKNPLATQTRCRICADRHALQSRITDGNRNRCAERRKGFKEQGLCIQCGQLSRENKSTCQTCADNSSKRQQGSKARAYQFEYRSRMRADAINAYGGKCACCGESNILFLTIDHINSDGAEYRREKRLSGGNLVYSWLKKNEYPDGFQVLCHNCNSGRAINNGICPHHGYRKTISESNTRAAGSVRTRISLRRRVFEVYGNQCACCGETNQLFLTLDHVNNNGSEHVKLVKHHETIYRDAIRSGKSDDFQLLCWNCNCGRSRNKGTCPHKEL